MLSIIFYPKIFRPFPILIEHPYPINLELWRMQLTTTRIFRRGSLVLYIIGGSRLEIRVLCSFEGHHLLPHGVWWVLQTKEKVGTIHPGQLAHRARQAKRNTTQQRQHKSALYCLPVSSGRLFYGRVSERFLKWRTVSRFVCWIFCSPIRNTF